MRFLHKSSGRLLLGLAFASCALGWSTVQKQAPLAVALFSLPLIVFMKATTRLENRLDVRSCASAVHGAHGCCRCTEKEL